ncbi:hypothetical protein BVRB_5g100160 [Beta vulgaris subsp. vulgaris]|nr:hypothetical protein BVRB_5g100160 [Beta vulgaris subsp. vulgaris]
MWSTYRLSAGAHCLQISDEVAGPNLFNHCNLKDFHEIEIQTHLCPCYILGLWLSSSQVTYLLKASILSLQSLVRSIV